MHKIVTRPGQATAYKTGEMKIISVRKTLEAELGLNFDVKDFHRSILNCYGPLEFLDECVRFTMKVSRNPRQPKQAGNGSSHFKINFVCLFVAFLTSSIFASAF
jgi:hypothetical protein